MKTLATGELRFDCFAANGQVIRATLPDGSRCWWYGPRWAEAVPPEVWSRSCVRDGFIWDPATGSVLGPAGDVPPAGVEVWES